MKRTVIRYSETINTGKWEQLCQIAHLFRDEKNVHLQYYNQDKNDVEADKKDHTHRDELVAQKYEPKTEFQARLWKTALKTAYETTDKFWCALAVELKPMIAKHKKDWSDAEMHDGYWLCYSGKRLAEWVETQAPVPTDFEVSPKGQKRVRNYLRRVIQRKWGNRPAAKLSRSFELGFNMVKLVEDGKDCKKQSIKIMGLVPMKRIVIPLTGHSFFDGTIKIVLDKSKKRIEVHTTNNLEAVENKSTEVIGLDCGVTEVFVDGLGRQYEPTFAITIATISKQLNKTGKERNKAHALQKASSKFKAQRIKKYNLGRKKLNERKRKAQIRIRQQISQAIHQVVKTCEAKVIVSERLDIRGKAKSKEISRQVSYWMRGSLKERLDFLAPVEGFDHKQVNPAYTSQMCPTCLFVHKDNRKGDIFQCLHCGHRDVADRVAAINLRVRILRHGNHTFYAQSCGQIHLNRQI
jgi:IS605 OrfB family transposase